MHLRCPVVDCCCPLVAGGIAWVERSRCRSDFPFFAKDFRNPRFRSPGQLDRQKCHLGNGKYRCARKKMFRGLLLNFRNEQKLYFCFDKPIFGEKNQSPIFQVSKKLNCTKTNHRAAEVRERKSA